MNAYLRGQKPMRRFRSPQGPALRAGQFSAAALWQAPCGKEMKGARNQAFANAFSAFLSVSKYGAVKLFESPGRAGGLPMESLPFLLRSSDQA